MTNKQKTRLYIDRKSEEDGIDISNPDAVIGWIIDNITSVANQTTVNSYVTTTMATDKQNSINALKAQLAELEG